MAACLVALGANLGDRTAALESAIRQIDRHRSVTVVQRSRWFHPRFLDPAGHPVFQGGVPVNRRFQPLNHDGSPVYENLWAAGGVLAHADPIRERSLEGIAIATGITAAQQISNQSAVSS